MILYTRAHVIIKTPNYVRTGIIASDSSKAWPPVDVVRKDEVQFCNKVHPKFSFKTELNAKKINPQ